MSTLIAEFTVVGTPVPQGSTRAFAGKGKAAGKVFTTNDPTGSIGKWRTDIKGAVDRAALGGYAEGPVSMRLTFRYLRPKSHFLPANAKRSELLLRLDAPDHPTGGSSGDTDKLCRAVLDALTGVCYSDDALVVSLGAVKRYANPGEQPGVDVRVVAL